MQTAGNRVGFLVEFAARVENGQHHFDGGLLLRLVHVDGNAAAVVDDGDRVVDVDGDIDVLAETRERFVDGVVDDFVNEMVQAAFARVADVHRGALAHRLNALEFLNFVSGIIAGTEGFDRPISFF